jgi:serine/threonine protein phosphatase PrpC
MTRTYRWAGITDTGKTRTENQDSVYPVGLGAGASGVVAVADGLGGHPGGDIASRCAIDAVARAPDGIDGAQLVGAAHDRIIARIAESLGERSELIAMATTLTLAVLSPTEPIEVAHVGDSRAYLATGSDIAQVTEDHTHGMDRVVAGELSLEEAQQDSDWHVMSNWLGFESYRVASYRVHVEPGDRLLLCTDGLSNMLDVDQIAEILNTGTVERSAAALIDAANEAGGLDNITVVVVEVLKDRTAPS